MLVDVLANVLLAHGTVQPPPRPLTSHFSLIPLPPYPIADVVYGRSPKQKITDCIGIDSSYYILKFLNANSNFASDHDFIIVKKYLLGNKKVFLNSFDNSPLTVTNIIEFDCNGKSRVIIRNGKVIINHVKIR